MDIPWLRTLDDAKADAAVRMLEQVARCLGSDHHTAQNTGASGTDIELRIGEFLGWSCDAKVHFSKGGLGVQARTLVGTDYQLISVNDTDSLRVTDETRISINAVTARLEYWVDGLRSPLVTQFPPDFERGINEFLNLVTAAAMFDEPSWTSLIIDPQHGPEMPIMTVIRYSDLVDFTIGEANFGYKLHSELAQRLVALRDAYIHVREEGGPGVHVSIGAPGTMSAEPCMSALDLMRVIKRFPDGFGLYG